MVYALLIAAAVALLGAVHLFTSRRGREPEPPPPGGRSGSDSWSRFLVAAALGATLFALGVVAVPALQDDDEEAVDTTQPTLPTTTESSTTGPEPTTSRPETTTTEPETTTTEPETTTTEPETTTTQPETTTTRPTTTRATTTRPTTTTTTPTTTTAPTPPLPEGRNVLVAFTVGPDGKVVRSVTTVGGEVHVRNPSLGVYRVTLPALTDEQRERAVVRLSVPPDTDAAGSFEGNRTLVVFVSDETTGAPAARAFAVALRSTGLPETK